VPPGHAATERYDFKVKWWSYRFEIPVDNILPVAIETLGFMPPKTEVVIARIAKETQDAHVKQVAQGGMPRHMSHTHTHTVTSSRAGLDWRGPRSQIGPGHRGAVRYETGCNESRTRRTE
jgi:hypothetical protein